MWMVVRLRVLSVSVWVLTGEGIVRLYRVDGVYIVSILC